MRQACDAHTRIEDNARALRAPHLRARFVTAFVAALALVAAPGCGATDPDDGGTSGSAGAGGGAGSGGAGGGRAGTSGSGGSAGVGGATGSGGSSGGSGQGGNAGIGGAAGGGTGGSAGGGGAGKGGNAGAAGSGGAAGRAGGAGTTADAGRADGSGGSAGGDAATDGPIVVDVGSDHADGRPADSGSCMAPNPNDPTLTAYQSDIVARLAGQTEIAPGVKLTNRATATNRQATRTYLNQLFQDLGLSPLEHNYGTGSNVYAVLPSTSGGTQSVVFGAHFDSVMVSPGANDNATGVAAVYAVARYATKLPCRSKALMFVMFDEEEVGLVGSKQFATKLKNDGTPIHSVHTIDQMGWDNNGNRAIELELPDTGLRELYQAAITTLGVAVPLTNTTTASTDHSSFRPTFLAVGLTEEYATKPSDTTPYYHKAGDTFDTVNFDYLFSTTVIVNQVAADLTR